MDKNWRIWDSAHQYGNYFKQRADGTLDEMESSKSICDIINNHYAKKMTVADIGCGCGHYLRSLIKRVDQNISYIGLDYTNFFLKNARQVFENYSFINGDIFHLPFKNNTFDIVLCSNVLLHIPPPPANSLKELIRITKKILILRIPLGVRNYIIKEVHDIESHSDEILQDNGTPIKYNYFNIYTSNYINFVIEKICKNSKVEIIRDLSFGNFDNRSTLGDTGSYTSNGQQISGNLLVDWNYIVITKN